MKLGIVGLPNVGKSSLLSQISSAQPKIAAYEFTTLSPNLGVVKIREGKGFVAADIPGIIEGASDGKGLGHDFLRHIDRCRLMLHVVDVSADCDRDPIEDMILINGELEKYSLDLSTRPQIVVANKYDASLPEYNEHVMDLEKYCKENNIKLFFISAVTGYNVKELVTYVADELEKLPPLTIYEPDFIPVELEDENEPDELEITKDGKVFVCESEWLWRLVGRVNFSDRDSLNYFQRMLRTNGIIDKLVEAGVKDGDTVRMYEFEFDFVN
jgi:GTP-binding protein